MVVMLIIFNLEKYMLYAICRHITDLFIVASFVSLAAMLHTQS